MVRLCREYNKPVIVATQMLDATEKGLLPTRAEVTDVYYAVKLGTDATMLSGETANGIDPTNAVKVMSTIDKESEFLFCHCQALDFFKKVICKKANISGEAKKIALSIAKKSLSSNCHSPAASFPYEAIVIFSDDNAVLKAISAARPGAAVIAITDNESKFNSYGVNYAIYTYLVDNIANAKSNAATIAKEAVDFYCTGSKKTCYLLDGKFRDIA
jgi:pyruvate kinase